MKEGLNFQPLFSDRHNGKKSASEIEMLFNFGNLRRFITKLIFVNRTVFSLKYFRFINCRVQIIGT
jgi:hypothetical protein